MNFGYRSTFVALVLILSALSWAAPGGRNRQPQTGGTLRTERRAIPKFDVQDSSFPTFLDSIGGMVVSDPYSTDYPWVRTGIDTIEVEIELLRQFVRGEGEFAWTRGVADKSQLFVYLNRYNMGDSRVSELLIEAHQQGMKVKFITDLSGTADIKHEQYDELGRFNQFHTLKPENFLDNQKGRQVSALMRAGAKFPDPNGELDPNFGITGIMYEKRVGVENPLQHMKAMLMGQEVDGQVTKIFGTDGTGNMGRHEAQGSPTLGTRSNRMLIEHDPVYLLGNKRHFEELYATYARGKETKDIRTHEAPPLEIHYPNGDVRRVMYTDGQYNPHDMTALVLASSFIQNDRAIQALRGRNPQFGELMDRMIASGQLSRRNTKITKIKMKQFLLTNRTIYEALIGAMYANPDLVLEGAFDQEFARVESQGLIAPLFGITAMREFGGNLRGARPGIVTRNKLYVYDRLIEGLRDNDRSTSWLSHYLLHDKTIMFWVTEADGTEKVHIFTKSFNMSNHVDNAEELDEIIVDADSPVVKAFEESMDKPREMEIKKGYYQRGLDAFLRDGIGRLTAHANNDIQMDEVFAIRKAYHERNYKEVRRLLEAILERASSLDTYAVMTAEQRKQRLDRLMALLEWQDRTDTESFAQKHYLTLEQRFILFCSAIANQDPLSEWERTENYRHPFQVWQAIEEVVNDATGERRGRGRGNRGGSAEARSVWTEVLGFGEVPTAPPRDDSGRIGGRPGAENANTASAPGKKKKGCAGPLAAVGGKRG